MSDKLNVKFNMRNLTAELFQKFYEGGRDRDNRAMAEVFAAVVVACPAEWGAHDDPKTYLKLPYFEEFQQLVVQMTAEANGKN